MLPARLAGANNHAGSLVARWDIRRFFACRNPESKTMSKSRERHQSATERRAAEAEVRALIGKHAPEHMSLVNAARQSLRKRLPTAHELVYEYRAWVVTSFSPSGHGHEGVFAVRADAYGVKLYFGNGKTLPDPEKLLKGSANVRYVEVEEVGTLKKAGIVALMDAAEAANRVAFDREGKGSVVVRSASAKKTTAKTATTCKASGKGSTSRSHTGRRGSKN